MNRTILAGCLALVLVLSLPMAVLAQETEETTAATESTEISEPAETTAPTEATEPTETAEPTATVETTQPTETTAPSEPETIPSEPPATTEATLPPETSAPPETTAPTESPVPPTFLEIDTAHLYPGMESTYQDGYSPGVHDGAVRLVLPLLASGPLYQDQLTASLGLGSGPFVMANYEKAFSLETIVPENSGVPQSVFLISFDVALSENRNNGVYPVTVTISGYDSGGNALSGSYTLYVTITDGKSPEAAPTPVAETPTAEPVVYISDTSLSPEAPMAGEEFTLTVTLKNSLTTKSVRNLLVTVDTENVHLRLLEKGSIFQIDKIPAGGEETLTLRLAADPALAAGSYPLSFAFRYDSSKSLNLSSSGSTLVDIGQQVNMELVMGRFSPSVTVGDTVPLSLQVMNMGRDPMYNVRCVVSGFGLAPANTGYIGTMAAGSSATTEVSLYIIALNASPGNEGSAQYGDTTGTVTLICENEKGEEFRQETTFDTRVDRALTQPPQADTNREEETQTAVWWAVVLALGLGILLTMGGLALGHHKKNRNSR